MAQSPHEMVMHALALIRQQAPMIGLIEAGGALSTLQTVTMALGAQPVPLLQTTDSDGFLKLVQAVVIDVTAFTRFEMRDMLLLMGQLRKKKIPWVFMPTDAALFDARAELVKMILSRRPTLLCAGEADFSAIAPRQKHTVASIFSRLTRDTLSTPRLIVSRMNDHLVTEVGAYRIGEIESLLNRMFPHVGVHAVLLAACLGAGTNGDEALFSAGMAVRAASKRALSIANGPGSFWPVFLDALTGLKRDYVYSVQIHRDSGETVGQLADQRRDIDETVLM